MVNSMVDSKLFLISMVTPDSAALNCQILRDTYCTEYIQNSFQVLLSIVLHKVGSM